MCVCKCSCVCVCHLRGGRTREHRASMRYRQIEARIRCSTLRTNEQNSSKYFLRRLCGALMARTHVLVSIHSIAYAPRSPHGWQKQRPPPPHNLVSLAHSLALSAVGEVECVGVRLHVNQRRSNGEYINVFRHWHRSQF